MSFFGFSQKKESSNAVNKKQYSDAELLSIIKNAGYVAFENPVGDGGIYFFSSSNQHFMVVADDKKIEFGSAISNVGDCPLSIINEWHAERNTPMVNLQDGMLFLKYPIHLGAGVSEEYILSILKIFVTSVALFKIYLNERWDY